jgi:hypothetical protein
MANAVVGHSNLASAITYSGGSWTAGLPLSNLADPVQGIVARSTNLTLASTQFVGDIGYQTIVQAIYLVAHNLSLSAKLRIRTSLAADFSVLVTDSGWFDAWPPVYQTDDLEWEADNWFEGTYTEKERQGYNWTRGVIFPDAEVVRYVKVEIDDATNNAGYVQIGRPFIGEAWQFEFNMLQGASIGWETATEVSEAVSGTEYFDPKIPRRSVSFTLGRMTEGEAMAKAFEVLRRMGIDGEVMFLWDPDDTVHALRRQFLGRFREMSRIENPYLDRHRAAFSIKESL